MIVGDIERVDIIIFIVGEEVVVSNVFPIGCAIAAHLSIHILYNRIDIDEPHQLWNQRVIGSDAEKRTKPHQIRH